MTASVSAVRVCDSDEVPERGRLVLDIGSTSVGLFRLAGRLYAYENSCPHQGGPVCQGLLIPGVTEKLGPQGVTVRQEFDEDDLHIVCPWHGFEYSVTTGAHAGTGRPRLCKYRVEEADGGIYLEL